MESISNVLLNAPIIKKKELPIHLQIEVLGLFTLEVENQAELNYFEYVLEFDYETLNTNVSYILKWRSECNESTNKSILSNYSRM